MATSIAAAATSFSVEPVKPAVSPPLPIAKVDSVMKNDPVSVATTDSVGARILEVEEYKAAALALAEAFVHDEVSRYFVDTPDRPNWTKQQKWELHVKIMEYITYAHLLKGLVVSAGPKYDCVALW